MCDNVWADVSCIRYVEYFSDLFVYICEMTKKGQKMSFHAGKIVIAAKTGIMESVVDFTERKKKILSSK